MQGQQNIKKKNYSQVQECNQSVITEHSLTFY